MDLNTSLGHVIFVIISAIAQLERDLIAERVRNGLVAARARGKLIGRKRIRNSALIESLLESGLSYREVARIAKCSHGSVHAQKKEMLARKSKEAAENKRIEEIKKSQEEIKLLPDGTRAKVVEATIILPPSDGGHSSNVVPTFETIDVSPQPTLA